jgi:hypothetical protein
MDYPVEASHPPIARFRLNESHFAAPLQSALILNPSFEQYNLRLISTPLESELSNRINSQYSTIIQFFDPPVNSQQSTVNNNSGATGIDITRLRDSF